MGSSLYWKPVIRSENKSLDDGLKRALEKRYDLWKARIFNESDVPYLQGLYDAGVMGAKDLLDLINIHGEVELKLEC